MKVYAGASGAARRYMEAGRGRADDYYLAEGTGIARRFVAAGGRVEELVPLTGDGYEAWVAGVDPETGLARGRLRDDDRALRTTGCGVRRGDRAGRLDRSAIPAGPLRDSAAPTGSPSAATPGTAQLLERSASHLRRCSGPDEAG